MADTKEQGLTPTTDKLLELAERWETNAADYYSEHEPAGQWLRRCAAELRALATRAAAEDGEAVDFTYYRREHDHGAER